MHLSTINGKHFAVMPTTTTSTKPKSPPVGQLNALQVQNIALHIRLRYDHQQNFQILSFLSRELKFTDKQLRESKTLQCGIAIERFINLHSTGEVLSDELLKTLEMIESFQDDMDAYRKGVNLRKTAD